MCSLSIGHSVLLVTMNSDFTILKPEIVLKKKEKKKLSLL